MESVGFIPDEPLEGGENASVLAIMCFGWQIRRFWERKYVGINPRWRVYRYVPGHVYRPHIDGAWPKSGVDPESGEYIYDASGGTTWSRMTFLIYLNQNFEGGVMDARAVKPQAGSVAWGKQGAKYIIRTDVLYAEV
ncbi:hypothetical protein BC829DRAFT_425201 [Chytridium lagenaria]|nr:hypothetical protein BC829DRAFT_425201 [Chytridium lagenaria]